MASIAMWTIARQCRQIRCIIEEVKWTGGSERRLETDQLQVYVCGKDATSSALKGAREITAASANKLVINVRIFRNGGLFYKVGIATRYGLDDSGIESPWG